MKVKRTKKTDPVMAELRAAFGKGVKMLSDGGLSAVREHLSTGIDVIDHVLLSPALPVGRVIEVDGEEGVGKTTLIIQWMKALIAQGARVVLFDMETTLQSGRAEELDLDTSKVILGEPDTLEGVISYIRVATRTARPDGPPTFIFWDTLAETPIMHEADAKQDTEYKEQMGIRARRMSELMRVEKRRLARSRTTLVIVNQLRKKLGVVYGDPWTTPGGDAAKYAAWAQIRLTRGKSWKINDKRVGMYVRAVTIKGKGGAPWRPVTLRMRYTNGYDNDWATVEYAVQEGILKPGGKGMYKTPRGKQIPRKDLARLAAIAKKYLWKEAP